MIGCNAAGGTHHAFRDRGEGYCIFNDIAVAVALGMRGMAATGSPGDAVRFRFEHRPHRQSARDDSQQVRPSREKGSRALCDVLVRVQRAAVIDLDVHQGNGTAAMLSPDAAASARASSGREGEQAGNAAGIAWAAELYGGYGRGGGTPTGGRGAFTASLHGEKNYPWKSRVHGSLDIGLDDGVGEEEYLQSVDSLLASVGRWLEDSWAAEKESIEASDGAADGRAREGETRPPCSPAGPAGVGASRSLLEQPYRGVRVTAVRRSGPEALERGAGSLLVHCDADLVHFQAGVDALKQDRLGRLGLSRAALHRRNQKVFGAVGTWGLPCVVTMGGGYARPIEASVRAHGDVFAQAAAAARSLALRREKELAPRRHP